MLDLEIGTGQACELAMGVGGCVADRLWAGELCTGVSSVTMGANI